MSSTLLDAGVCCNGCQGKIKSFSWGIRKGESCDGGPLSYSSAGCISPLLYNCVKGALPVAPSLLTGMVSPWQPDTPCPLVLSLSPPVSLIPGCPSASSPPLTPLGNPPYCYFWPTTPIGAYHLLFSPIFFDILLCHTRTYCAAFVLTDVTYTSELML